MKLITADSGFVLAKWYDLRTIARVLRGHLSYMFGGKAVPCANCANTAAQLNAMILDKNHRH